MKTDFLVIGSGVAGLTFAIEAAKYGEVVVITKKETPESNTNYAQGGIAASIGKKDSIELHVKDTLRVGERLCNRRVVELVVREAPKVIEKLNTLGVKFTKNENGKLDLGQEGGHSVRRIVHTKDTTGKEIESNLIKVVKNKGVEIIENLVAMELVLKDGECCGVWVINREGESEVIFSKITFIATGGIGRVYLYTTNPNIATGDGIAMVYRRGGVIANMEFVQFHPTTFYGKKINDRAFLLSETIRGEGGILYTQDGERFMKKYHPKKELAPRDVVARAIHMELKKRKHKYVLLDITHLPEEKIKTKFPNIYTTCLSLNVNPAKTPIPVVPAAHYLCGGIVVDINGKTTIPYLFAGGECIHSGFHGANRLASNSLLESVVIAERAAKEAKELVKQRKWVTQKVEKRNKKKEFPPDELLNKTEEEVKKLMWEKVGIVRNTKELTQAKVKLKKTKEEIKKWKKIYKINTKLVELENIVEVGELITLCALKRKESRGLHYNINYPKKNDKKFKKDTIIKGI
jgi:L-aspartate oxidase